MAITYVPTSMEPVVFDCTKVHPDGVLSVLPADGSSTTTSATR